MVNYKPSIKEIAVSFSNGNFELAFPYLSENITWNIIGENVLTGKTDVIANCQQTAAYFKSVQTNFITDHIIVADNKVVVSGTAEFIKDGRRVNFFSACDVYEFNANHELEKISSYCISDKK